jgi:hypothetical protein
MESFPVFGWKPARTVNLEYKTFYLYRMPLEIDEKYIPGNSSTDNPDYSYYY